MKNILKNSKRKIVASLLILCLLLSISGTCVYAVSVKQGGTNEVANVEEELVPMMAGGCASVPQRAYSMYSYITAGNDPDIYQHHPYLNTTYPYLPDNTTYVTYHMTGSARLVIGANGSAYYSPDHYSSWINMF